MPRPIWIALLLLVPSAAPSPQDAKAEPLTLSFGVYQSDKATPMYRQYIPVTEGL